MTQSIEEKSEMNKEMNNGDNKNAPEIDEAIGNETDTLESNSIGSDTKERDYFEWNIESEIYRKFLTGIDPSVLQATTFLGNDTVKEVRRNLNANDESESGFIKSELAKLRLKLIFMQRLSAFEFDPDCRKGLLDAIKDFKLLELVGLYKRIDNCVETINIMQAIASKLDIDPQILKRAKTVLMRHLRFFIVLSPSTAAATAISISVLTFHAKCVYSIIQIAQASNTAESNIYHNIKQLLKYKGFPNTDFQKFYVIESLVFSFKGFFLANKKMQPHLIEQYKTAQNRFCTRILICVQSDYINSIRFRRKFLPLKEFFETNLMHLIDGGFISFTYKKKLNITTYRLTHQGQEELERSRELYRDADEISKLGERSNTEDLEVWEGVDGQDSFSITLPLEFLMHPKENGET